MYRLVSVAGIDRGKSFSLSQGGTVIGRDPSCQILLNYDGISKRHLRLNITDHVILMEDLGSANGTLINQKLMKNGLLQLGDLITLPGITFRLVQEKKAAILPSDGGQLQPQMVSINHYFFEDPRNMTSLFQRFHYLFKTKLLSVLYEFNKTYEWRSLLAMMIFGLVCVNLLFTLGPVLDDSKKLIVEELKLRGKQYVDEVARNNALALARLDLDALNDRSLKESSSDLEDYLIFDQSGRVIRPIDKLNTYINDSFAVELVSWSKLKKENASKVFSKSLGEGYIGVGKAIVVLSGETQGEQVVGYVALKMRPKTLMQEVMANREAYLESFIISCSFAFFIYLSLFYLTKRNLAELAYQLELYLQGRQRELKSPFLMEELQPLQKIIKQLLERLSLNEEQEMGPVDSESSQVYYQQGERMLDLFKGEGLLLDDQKNILRLTPEAEDLLGIREAAAIQASLLDTLRDQGMAANIIEQCDSASMAQGTSELPMEIKGIPYLLKVLSIRSKDDRTRCFYLRWVKTEGAAWS